MDPTDIIRLVFWRKDTDTEVSDDNKYTRSVGTPGDQCFNIDGNWLETKLNILISTVQILMKIKWHRAGWSPLLLREDGKDGIALKWIKLI